MRSDARKRMTADEPTTSTLTEEERGALWRVGGHGSERPTWDRLSAAVERIKANALARPADEDRLRAAIEAYCAEQHRKDATTYTQVVAADLRAVLAAHPAKDPS